MYGFALQTKILMQAVNQVTNLGLVVTFALIIWRFLVFFTGSSTPVVVVLSGSMEPAFYRGDILFLFLGRYSASPAEIVVFAIEGRQVPIVHRIVHKQGAVQESGKFLLTKGDNNFSDDTVLYARGQDWLVSEDVMGVVAGFLPLVGRVTILMNDYPYLKYAIIGILGLLVVMGAD
jgi:signal peptidase I